MGPPPPSGSSVGRPQQCLSGKHPPLGGTQQVNIGYRKLGGLEDLDGTLGTQDPCDIPGMDG